MDAAVSALRSPAHTDVAAARPPRRHRAAAPDGCHQGDAPEAARGAVVQRFPVGVQPVVLTSRAPVIVDGALPAGQVATI